MVDRARCPKCQKYFRYVPATDIPRCGHCGWEQQAPEPMKVITLWQPWASLIIDGHKTTETRLHDRFKKLAGKRIAIHAGKTYDPDAWRQVNLWTLDADARKTAAPENARLLPMGAILGTADVLKADWLDMNMTSTKGALINCHDELRFGLFLADVVMFGQPIPCGGRQGVWRWECPVDA